MAMHDAPKINGESYSITSGEVTLTCGGANSGRITAFSLGNKNVLTDASVNPFNFGSTFWTAPQSDWDWPPPKAQDSDASWAASIEGNAIVLRSGVCDKLNIQIEKRIQAAAGRSAFIIDYSIRNAGDARRAFAPWEISRVAPGGMTFFPHGDHVYPPPSWQEPLVTQASDGITWFVHSDDTVTAQHKLFADGKEGWIAHVTGDLLFIKSFEPMSFGKRAPGEAEIEIYAVPEYVEVEQQGNFEPIEPGASRTWRVTWHLTRIPTDIGNGPNNPTLAARVRSIAAV